MYGQVDIPKDREFALDIVWACIRNKNEAWMGIFPDTIGCQIVEVARELGWSYSTVERLVKIMVSRGQLTRKWNHTHQTYWSAHYKTLGERPRGGNKQDPEVSDIPF